MAHPRKQTSLAAAAVAIPFSQKLVLAIKAYLKNDVLDRRPSLSTKKAKRAVFDLAPKVVDVRTKNLS